MPFPLHKRKTVHDWLARTGICLFLLIPPNPVEIHAASREQLIPILSVTKDRQPEGSVSYISAALEKRADHHGLVLRFHDQPGRFSPSARASTEKAIRQAAAILGLSTDSWTVDLTVPYHGVTLSGDSLSAMVGISISAMAQGRRISSGYVLTGTVHPDGKIGPVGSLSLKIQAARHARLRRVLVPYHQSPASEPGPASSTFQVSPVRSVPEALAALTGVSGEE